MKYLITTIAALVLVGCGRFENSATAPEAKPVEPVAEVPAQPSPPPVEAKPDEPVAEAKAPNISIHAAILMGKIDSVKKHLAAGTDVNAPDNSGWTPLHHATFNSEKEIAALLLSNGANVNALEKGSDYTPLHLALQTEGSAEIVELLIANDADVNVTDDIGKSPLDHAYGEGEITDLLRKHGGKTGEELKTAETAISEAPVTSIQVAAENGNLKALKKLLDDGADVNAKDSSGSTPLHNAAGQKEIAELLITKGANVIATNMHGMTPLHIAAQLGCKEVVELLITKGADVNAIDIDGSTPLNYAKSYKSTEDLLRKHGAKTGEELKAEGK